MNISIILWFLFGAIAPSLSERLEKVEGTSGEFSDIVVDNENRWYIIRDSLLHYSLDMGKTLIKIPLPSQESVYKGLGIDQFDNIYVQDKKLSVFIVAPSIHETFVFEKLKLENGEERLQSRPFALGDNVVYLVTKSGMMEVENGFLLAKTKEISPSTKKEITQLVRYNISERYGDSFEEMFYGVKGNFRNWIYVISSETAAPLCQTKGPIKRLNVVRDRVYFTVNYENGLYVIEFKESPRFIPQYYKQITHPRKLDGMEDIEIDDDSDFIIFSRVNDYKTYIYGNVGDSGIVHGLDTFVNNGKNVTQIVTSNKLDNVRILCGAIQDDKLYFGTSNGVYELKDIHSAKS